MSDEIDAAVLEAVALLIQLLGSRANIRSVPLIDGWQIEVTTKNEPETT